MECPKCHFDQDAKNLECIRCGLIFSKYVASVESPPEEKSKKTIDISVDEIPEESSLFSKMKELLFYVEPDVNVFHFSIRNISTFAFPFSASMY